MNLRKKQVIGNTTAERAIMPEFSECVLRFASAAADVSRRSHRRRKRDIATASIAAYAQYVVGLCN